MLLEAAQAASAPAAATVAVSNYDRVVQAVSSANFVPTTILIALLGLAALVALRAQSRDDFDFADMLRGDDGKVSNTKMFSFISIAVTSWMVAYLTISGKITPEYFWYYLVVWSGTAVALKLVDKWNGSLPFTRGDMQQAMQGGAQAAALGAAAATPGNQPVVVTLPGIGGAGASPGIGGAGAPGIGGAGGAAGPNLGGAGAGGAP